MYKFNTQLDIGAKGNDVMELQRFLNNAGYAVSDNGAGSKGNETQYFGSKTAAALKKYQADNKIETVGRLGPKTLAAINSYKPAGDDKNVTANSTAATINNEQKNNTQKNTGGAPNLNFGNSADAPNQVNNATADSTAATIQQGDSPVEANFNGVDTARLMEIYQGNPDLFTPNQVDQLFAQVAADNAPVRDPVAQQQAANPNIQTDVQQQNRDLSESINSDPVFNITSKKGGSDLYPSVDGSVKDTTVNDQKAETAKAFSQADAIKQFYASDEYTKAQSTLLEKQAELDKIDSELEDLKSDIIKETDGEATESYINAMVTVRGKNIYKRKRLVQSDYKLAVAEMTMLTDQANAEISAQRQDQQDQLAAVKTALDYEYQSNNYELNLAKTIASLHSTLPAGQSISVGGYTVTGSKSNSSGYNSAAIQSYKVEDENGNIQIIRYDERSGAMQAFNTGITAGTSDNEEILTQDEVLSTFNTDELEKVANNSSYDKAFDFDKGVGNLVEQATFKVKKSNGKATYSVINTDGKERVIKTVKI